MLCLHGVNKREYYIMHIDTSTQQLVYQLASLVISGFFTVVGIYLKKWLSASAVAKEYGLYNDKVERVLENAIHYAEECTINVTGKAISKKEMSLKYIEMISPDIIAKEGDKLDYMIDRKVKQVLH